MRYCGEAAAARRRVSLTEPLRSTRLVPQTYTHTFVFHAFLPIPTYSYVLLCNFLSTTESANVILGKMSVDQLPFISLKHRALVTFLKPILISYPWLTYFLFVVIGPSQTILYCQRLYPGNLTLRRERATHHRV